MRIDRATFETPRTVPVHSVRPPGDDPVTDVVVVLHGLMQRASALAEQIAPAVRPGQRFVVPEGLSRSLPRPLAPKAGASWSTGEDAADDLADNLRWLDAVVARAVALHPGARLTLVGFSQGGLMAARWIAARAHPWHRVVLWASVLPDDASPDRVRANLGAAELVVVLGDTDPFVSQPVRALAGARLAALDRPWRLHPFPGGHEVAPAALAEVLS